MLTLDLSFANVVQCSPFQFQQCLQVICQVVTVRMQANVYDDQYIHVVLNFNSLLIEMITPQIRARGRALLCNVHTKIM